MAARVLLLSILFTEVLKPASAAGVRGVGGKDGPKLEGLEVEQIGALGVTLETEPGGDVVVGRKGVTLSCSAGPNRKISWLRNGVSVPPCGSMRCTQWRNGSLHFYKKKNMQIAQKRGGRDRNNSPSERSRSKEEYRCIAHSASGGSIRSSPAFVQMAELSHVFKESPKNLTVQEGEVARFSCLIDSIPSPANITWQHNGQSILPVHNNTKYFMVSPGVLYISATKPSDAGSYRCVATNEFLNKTKKSKEANLTVVLRHVGEESQVPALLFPQIFYHYKLFNGSNITLICAASGYPSPIVTWTFVPHSSDDISIKQPRQLFNSTGGIGTLALKNISATDAGIYYCSTKSYVNDIPQTQNITIDVLVPPTFIKKPTNEVCPNGKTARFDCQAEGSPTPRIYWLKDTSTITMNGRTTTYVKENNRTELAISATVPSDSGVYQCVAVNAGGEIWAAGRLQVMSVNSPAAPTSLNCYALSPTKIFISWEPPKSLPSASVTAYTIHYSPMEEGSKEEVSLEPGNLTNAEVSKLLEPFTNYTFYIRVYATNHASNQSPTVVCSTAPSVPIATPKMKLDGISSTTLNVSWIPLTKKEARGMIVEYKLQWRLHQHPSSKVKHIPFPTNNYTLTDLTPGAQYNLRVLARTEQGWPNISEAQLAWYNVTMPPDDSTYFPLKNMVNMELINVNASIIKVRWIISKESTAIEPVFNSWELYYENLEGERLATVVLPKTTMEHQLTNLEANVSYVVGLCMINSGERKGCLVKQSQFGIGNAPTALEAVPGSATSINVTWAISPTSEANHYELCYHTVHNTDSDDSACIRTNETRVTVSNLKPFTLYQFNVRTLHNIGNHSSPYSETIECYTDEDIPGVVRDVQVHQWNSTTIGVAWKQPEELNGLIQSYHVSYTTNSSETLENWPSVTVSGSYTYADLSGLAGGRRYYVVTRAATNAGYGKPSDTISLWMTQIPETTSPRGLPKQPNKPKPDQSLGVIIGVCISVCCIFVCLSSIYCRKKCENSQLPREITQPVKGRGPVRNGNGCCVERTSLSASQNAPATVALNEIELAAVLCLPSPITMNPHCDTKGSRSNGILESSAKEPLLTPWDVNGETRDSSDLHITENPQYNKRRCSVGSIRQQDEHDLDGTQLTTVNCTLGSSSSSLNNNPECLENASSLQSAPSTSTPVLGPNG